MISVYKIKPRFQSALQPVLKLLRKLGITPNQLTLSAVFLSMGIGVLILFHQQYPVMLLSL